MYACQRYTVSSVPAPLLCPARTLDFFCIAAPLTPSLREAPLPQAPLSLSLYILHISFGSSSAFIFQNCVDIS